MLTCLSGWMSRQPMSRKSTHHLWRPCPRPGRALHGGAGGHAKNPVIQTRTALVAGGEGEETRVDGVHVEAAHDSQRHAEERDAVAGRGQSAGLLLKTIADPDSCGSQLRPACRTAPRIGSSYPWRSFDGSLASQQSFEQVLALLL